MIENAQSFLEAAVRQLAETGRVATACASRTQAEALIDVLRDRLPLARLVPWPATDGSFEVRDRDHHLPQVL